MKKRNTRRWYTTTKTKTHITENQERIKYEKIQKQKKKCCWVISHNKIHQIKKILSLVSALCYVTIKNNSKTQFLDSTKKLTNKTELNINVIRLELKEWKSCFGKMLLNELKMKKMVYVNCIICTWEYSIIVCIYGQLTSLIFRIQTREIQRTKISLLLKSTSVSRFHHKKSITALCQIYLFIIYFQFI